MQIVDLVHLVQQREAAGLDHAILRTTRAKEPGVRAQLLPGLSARVVGTERRGDGFLVVLDVRVADLRRWLERRGIKIATPAPDATEARGDG